MVALLFDDDVWAMMRGAAWNDRICCIILLEAMSSIMSGLVLLV